MNLRIRDTLEEVFRRLPISSGERFESFNRLARSLRCVDEVGGYAGKVVLDLGAGNGAHACAAKRLGAARVVAVDKYIYPDSDHNSFRIPEDAFSSLRNEWASFGVEARAGDLNNRWDFANSSFDTVVSNAVFEHLHGSHKHFLLEAFRVLKPGGVLLVCTPNLAYLPKRIRLLLGKSPNWDLKDFFDSGTAFTGHTREFISDELRQVAEWSDFQIIYCRSFVTYFRWAWLLQPSKIRRLPFVILALLGRHFGDHIYLVARKPMV